MAGSLRSVGALTIHPSSSRVFFQAVQQWRQMKQPSSPCPGSAMGRGTGTCGHSCPIQQWDLSREKPGLSRGGRKAPLEGERVGDTKQELLWMPCQGEQSLWVSSWITQVLLPGSWLCFSLFQNDPPRAHITAHPLPSCWRWRGRNQGSEMGVCICCFFCGSAAPALEISVGCPPPVNSPFTV